MKTYCISWGPNVLELGKKTRIMGVVNVTPDSFSDGGDFYDHDHAVKQGLKLYHAGADILDIGGESTRPFSDHVDIDEELRRVLPVIESLAKKVPIPISIDTTKSVVAEKAVAAGASMINDISAFRFDPQMVKAASALKVPVILMHMRGTPKNMQQDPIYEDVVSEVTAFLKNAIDDACKNGVERGNIIVDPGIGFGKTFEHNLTLLKNLSQLHTLDIPILIGASRKAFIRHLVKNKIEENMDPKGRLVETGSQAAVSVSALLGAHIVRVHNVENTRATLNIIDAIKNASDK